MFCNVRCLLEMQNTAQTLHYLVSRRYDPSGLDMVRDIRKRFQEFGLDINVQKIALTTEQVELYNPPPNPAKIPDPRAKAYIEEFGAVSWEVDALKPDVLDRLLREKIESVIDMGLFENAILEEGNQRSQLYHCGGCLMQLLLYFFVAMHLAP